MRFAARFPGSCRKIIVMCEVDEVDEMRHFSGRLFDFNLFKGTRMPVASAKVPAAVSGDHSVRCSASREESCSCLRFVDTGWGSSTAGAWRTASQG